MKKIYLILLTVLSFLSFNRSVYAVLTNSDVLSDTCEKLEEDGKLSDENLLFDASGYSTNCIYTLTSEDTCKVMQLAFNIDGTYNVKYLPVGDDDSVSYIIKDGWWVFDKVLDNTYIRDRVGACPKNVGYDGSTESGAGSESSWYQVTFSFDGAGKKMKKFLINEYKLEVPQLIVKDPNATGDTCTDILGAEGVKLLKTIKNLVMIMIPILLVVLATVDIVSAIFSGDENKIKKTQGKLIKRIIIAVVIFLAPVMLGFLFDVINMIWPNLNLDFCGVF